MRNAETGHVNYILVVGEQEEKGRTLAVRNYKTKEQTEVSIDDCITNLLSEIQTKSL